MTNRTEDLSKLKARRDAAQVVLDTHYDAIRSLQSVYPGLDFTGVIRRDPFLNEYGMTTGYGTYIDTPFKSLIAAAAKVRNSAEGELHNAKRGQFRNPIPAGHVECDRCGGYGGHCQWPGFVCYKCDGAGTVESR